jgi:hypothetical protein
MMRESVKELAANLVQEAQDLDLRAEIEKRLKDLDLKAELQKRLPDVELPRLSQREGGPSAVLIVGIAAGLLLGLAGAAALVRWQRALKRQGWTLMPDRSPNGTRSVLRDPVTYIRTMLGRPDGDGYRPSVEEETLPAASAMASEPASPGAEASIQ